MRLPVNSPYTRGAKFGATGRAYLGDSRVHNGQDLSSLDRKIIAPQSGTASRGYDSANGHYSVVLNGNFRHFLGHQAKAPYVGKVTEGQHIGTMGSTGLSTGIHTHWSIRRITNGRQGAIEDPMKYVTNNSSGGDNMFKTDAEVKEAYLLLRGNVGTSAERKAWIGQSKQRFFKVAKPEADSTRKQLADVKAALAKLKSQPAKTVIKEVEKIVEVPVEVITIKEINTVTEVEKPYSWRSVIDWVVEQFKKIRSK